MRGAFLNPGVFHFTPHRHSRTPATVGVTVARGPRNRETAFFHLRMANRLLLTLMLGDYVSRTIFITWPRWAHPLWIIPCWVIVRLGPRPRRIQQGQSECCGGD
jgi:hypothetical protein